MDDLGVPLFQETPILLTSTAAPQVILKALTSWILRSAAFTAKLLLKRVTRQSSLSLSSWFRTALYPSPKHLYMGVSWSGGTPKSSILMGFSIINHPFGGTPISGNPHMQEVQEVNTAAQTRFCSLWNHCQWKTCHIQALKFRLTTDAQGYNCWIHHTIKSPGRNLPVCTLQVIDSWSLWYYHWKNCYIYIYIYIHYVYMHII